MPYFIKAIATTCGLSDKHLGNYGPEHTFDSAMQCLLTLPKQKSWTHETHNVRDTPDDTNAGQLGSLTRCPGGLKPVSDTSGSACKETTVPHHYRIYRSQIRSGDRYTDLCASGHWMP